MQLYSIRNMRFPKQLQLTVQGSVSTLAGIVTGINYRNKKQKRRRIGMLESTTDHSQCIDELINSKAKYPYYYWFIWIFFLISLAAILTFNLFHDMPLTETGLSDTISNRTQHAVNHNALMETREFGQQIFLPAGRAGSPLANNQPERHRTGIIN